MHPKYAQQIPGLAASVVNNVKAALAEDIGTGDITAQLIPAEQTAKARVITREDCTFCGQAWVTEVFRQLDPAVSILWQVQDGDQVKANSTLFELTGNARHLLTGERTALNFVQLLSGTATRARHYANLVADLPISVLDTRKTIPGLRCAQKYAVACGGCHNHRQGLFDAFLIKENHIAACGGIASAVRAARRIAPDKTVEVEVENLPELDEALAAGADIIMLDEMDLAAVNKHLAGRCVNAQLEISGNLEESSINRDRDLLAHISRISLGLLTKHCRAIDLSMRIS